MATKDRIRKEYESKLEHLERKQLEEVLQFTEAIEQTKEHYIIKAKLLEKAKKEQKDLGIRSKLKTL